jgi:hypothetical protein
MAKKTIEKKSASQRRVAAGVRGYAKKKAAKKVNTIPETEVSVVPDADQDPDLYARGRGE